MYLWYIYQKCEIFTFYSKWICQDFKFKLCQTQDLMAFWQPSSDILKGRSLPKYTNWCKKHLKIKFTCIPALVLVICRGCRNSAALLSDNNAIQSKKTQKVNRFLFNQSNPFQRLIQIFLIIIKSQYRVLRNYFCSFYSLHLKTMLNVEKNTTVM